MQPIIGPGTMYVYMWRTREDAALDHWGNGEWPLPGRRRPGEWVGGVISGGGGAPTQHTSSGPRASSFRTSVPSCTRSDTDRAGGVGAKGNSSLGSTAGTRAPPPRSSGITRGTSFPG